MLVLGVVCLMVGRIVCRDDFLAVCFVRAMTKIYKSFRIMRMGCCADGQIEPGWAGVSAGKVLRMGVLALVGMLFVRVLLWC